MRRSPTNGLYWSDSLKQQIRFASPVNISATVCIIAAVGFSHNKPEMKSHLHPRSLASGQFVEMAFLRAVSQSAMHCFGRNEVKFSANHLKISWYSASLRADITMVMMQIRAPLKSQRMLRIWADRTCKTSKRPGIKPNVASKKANVEPSETTRVSSWLPMNSA